MSTRIKNSTKHCDVIVILMFSISIDRLRMDKLELNVNAALDDANNDRKRQLKLSFPAEELVATTIIKTPSLPDRTRYPYLP